MIQKAIRFTHKKLESTIKKWDQRESSEVKNPPYNSLSPICDADVDDYVQALNWALENSKEKDIYNIALTGTYGSGKSSILKTFQKQNTNERLVFLELSLATFKEERNNEEKTDEEKKKEGAQKVIVRNRLPVRQKDDLLRLIELSILQQIFYHEEDKRIPDSRFKKIKSFKRKAMALIAMWILASLIFGFNFFYPLKVQSLLNIRYSDIISTILRWVSLAVLLLSLYVVIFRSIRLLFGLSISKLKFQEAEIEIDKNISKSILNNHLDEILYFFEVTDYSVVIIEDLDRFQQSEIFTKLRELNLLINKSKKVKRDVVFIYAVRDDIFRDKERTKFFDFIIPVIPVINASNSNETLSSIITHNGYAIGKDIVEDVSLFIDDMRLLYNITNEYHLYHTLLSKELDQNKLFAIIVYKNIYPEDFVSLSEEKGKLYEIINNRKSYIQDKIKVVNQQIIAIKNSIEKIENHLIRDECDLRMLYLGNYVNDLSNFSAFVIQGTNRSLTEVADSQDLFDYIINDNVSYIEYYHNYSYFTQRTIKSSIKFEEIEGKVHEGLTFKERLDLIRNHSDDQLELLKKNIQKLEKEKIRIRHYKIKELLSDRSMDAGIDIKTKQGQLLSILLRAGYIDEDYMDYISLFYEGSLTKADRSYLLNIKGQNALSYDFRLSKIDNLIDKMREVDFQESYVLNYALLDHLLDSERYGSRLNMILTQLNDSNEYAPSFIDGFINNAKNIEKFIDRIVISWPGIWHYVDAISVYPEERKLEYLKLILKHAKIDAIRKMTSYSTLQKTIEQLEGFLRFLNDESRTKEIILNLDIKFGNVDFESGSQELGQFIHEGNFYEISLKMVERIMKFNGNFNRSEFESANYSFIMEFGSKFLTNYITDNINTYISHIYLNLTNDNEPEGKVIELLNNNKINTPYRVKIIENSKAKIAEVSKVVSPVICEALIKRNMVVPNWTNVFHSYSTNENKLSEGLISFLNTPENAATLAEIEIDTEVLKVDDSIVEAFFLSLVKHPGISISNYALLQKADPYTYDLSEIEKIDQEKMAILVETRSISVNAKNFAGLKSDYPDLLHRLIESNPAAFEENLSSFEIDGNDILFCLHSEKLPIHLKGTIVESSDLTIISSNVKILNRIVELSFNYPKFLVPKDVIIAALKMISSVDNRVKLFNMRFEEFSKSEIQDVFKSFPYPYSDIGVLHKSPVIPFGKENTFLANNLRSKKVIANTKDENKGIRLINFKK